MIFRRAAGSFIVVVCAGLVASGCETTVPTWPSKTDPNPPAKNVVFTPPVVRSVTAAATRVEVDQTVAVTANVEDAETPLANLSYVWSATVGVVTGNGTTATWRLPKGSATTPANVVITLRVIEKFTQSTGGQVVERELSATANAAPFRVHDSPAEIAQLTVSFLVDKFGNSNVAPGACLVDFSDRCAQGKSAELNDISDNRARFVILSAIARVTEVLIDGNRTFADVLASCEFRDRELATGKLGFSQGSCLLTAIYDADRWWLCTSNFFGTSTSQAIKGTEVHSAEFVDRRSLSGR